MSIHLSHSDLTREHVLVLTHVQVNKMTKAYQSNIGTAIEMSKTQLVHNTKVEGGIIRATLPMLATAGKFLV